MNEQDLKNMKLKVKLEDMEPVKCKRCRGEFFQQAISIRRISAILSPTGKEEFGSIPVLVCLNCKELLHPEQVGGAATGDGEEESKIKAP